MMDFIEKLRQEKKHRYYNGFYGYLQFEYCKKAVKTMNLPLNDFQITVILDEGMLYQDETTKPITSDEVFLAQQASFVFNYLIDSCQNPLTVEEIYSIHKQQILFSTRNVDIARKQEENINSDCAKYIEASIYKYEQSPSPYNLLNLLVCLTQYPIVSYQRKMIPLEISWRECLRKKWTPFSYTPYLHSYPKYKQEKCIRKEQSIYIDKYYELTRVYNPIRPSIREIVGKGIQREN